MGVPNSIFEEKLNVSVISRSLPNQKFIRINALERDEDKILHTTIIVSLIVLLLVFLI
ncbi:hypothetical protein CCP1ISM_260004 [Azospirillaceae bacterium]